MSHEQVGCILALGRIVKQHNDMNRPLSNPLSPKCDQHQISPHNINGLSRGQVMRLDKITIGKSLSLIF